MPMGWQYLTKNYISKIELIFDVSKKATFTINFVLPVVEIPSKNSIAVKKMCVQYSRIN